MGDNPRVQLTDALTYARGHRRGVLATVKADGRPQLSNVVYSFTPDDVVRISTTQGRAKVVNVLRDPRVSLHVTAPDFRSYVVIDGEAELSPVAEDPNGPELDELIEMYRAIRGERDDWAAYRAEKVAERRRVLRIRPVHAYGLLPRE